MSDEQPALLAQPIDDTKPHKMIVDHWDVGSFHVNALKAAPGDNSLMMRDLLRDTTARYNLLRRATQPLVEFHGSQPNSVRWNPRQTAVIPMGLLIDLFHDRMDACAFNLIITPDMLKPAWVL